VPYLSGRVLPNQLTIWVSLDAAFVWPADATLLSQEGVVDRRT
jgi:hypothetical protein